MPDPVLLAPLREPCTCTAALECHACRVYRCAALDDEASFPPDEVSSSPDVWRDRIVALEASLKSQRGQLTLLHRRLRTLRTVEAEALTLAAAVRHDEKLLRQYRILAQKKRTPRTKNATQGGG
jgi:hypothetical protein